MSDSIVVDVSHLRRLSREFRDAADELRTRTERFRTRSGLADDAYGRLPAADSAAQQYRNTAGQTLDNLDRMYRDLNDTATALDAQADQFLATEQAAGETATALPRGF